MRWNVFKSSETIGLQSSGVAWTWAATFTPWRNQADCSTLAPRPRERHRCRQWTAAMEERRERVLTPRAGAAAYWTEVFGNIVFPASSIGLPYFDDVLEFSRVLLRSPNNFPLFSICIQRKKTLFSWLLVIYQRPFYTPVFCDIKAFDVSVHETRSSCSSDFIIQMH